MLNMNSLEDIEHKYIINVLYPVYEAWGHIRSYISNIQVQFLSTCTM